MECRTCYLFPNGNRFHFVSGERWAEILKIDAPDAQRFHLVNEAWCGIALTVSKTNAMCTRYKRLPLHLPNPRCVRALNAILACLRNQPYFSADGITLPHAHTGALFNLPFSFHLVILKKPSTAMPHLHSLWPHPEPSQIIIIIIRSLAFFYLSRQRAIRTRIILLFISSIFFLRNFLYFVSSVCRGRVWHTHTRSLAVAHPTARTKHTMRLIIMSRRIDGVHTLCVQSYPSIGLWFLIEFAQFASSTAFRYVSSSSSSSSLWFLYRLLMPSLRCTSRTLAPTHQLTHF